MRWEWATAIVLCLLPAAISAGETGPLHELIDRHIEAAFARYNASPGPLSTDEEFVRRLHLDLTGRIPTAEAVRNFLADTSDDKRTVLIDRLLKDDRFNRHMAEVLDVMWMERRPDDHITTELWRGYLQSSLAAKKPLDQLVAEVLGADGTDAQLRPAVKFYLDRGVEKDTLVRDIGRLFLGVDLQCAQCHDHPDIADFQHEHYHGLSVFVAGTSTFRQESGTTVLQETVTREVEFASVFEPDLSRKTGPRLLDTVLEIPEVADGEEYVEKPARNVRAVPKFSLRELMSRRLPSRETPQFARNMANRLWATFLGRGLVHPLDMHHADNPPSHPELLTALADELVRSKFDLQLFVRELLLSRTYQRSSLAPPDVDVASLPPESFAVANLRGLSPEQLFESLLLATGSEDLLNSQIETSLEEATSNEDKTEKAKLVAQQVAQRRQEFVDLFGSPPGQAEGELQASLPQSLFLANNENVLSWLEPGEGNLAARMMQLEQLQEIVNEVYLNILSRWPSEEEASLAKEFLKQGMRRQQVVELIWSLAASAEFRLNH